MTSSRTVTTRLADGRTLRAAFGRSGDRFGHEVALVGPRDTQVLLVSLENGEDPAWPASPPLQQISLEANARQQSVAMLLGMAGRNHWSLSVEPVGAGLVFDVACRIAGTSSPQLGTQLVTRLGSQYEAGQAVLPQPDGTVLLPTDGEPLYLQALSVEGVPTARLEVIASGKGVRVKPGETLGRPTARWKYRIGARP